MNIWGVVKGFLFGNSDKGIIEQTSDVVDKWNPSATTVHKQSIEDLKVGDDSQKSARDMQLPTHDDLFNRLVDGLNRLVRPVVTYWVVGILVGILPIPDLTRIPPMLWNIIWTVVTFWFGSRVIFKDIPSIIKQLRK